MSLLDSLSENIFIHRSSNIPTDIVDLLENISNTYPFLAVDRRPHLTMEFPIVFNKLDSVNAVAFRSILYEIIMPIIKEYVIANNLSYMYPKKDFITVSKLLPGPGMGLHVDNPSKDSNHFICMVYLNDTFEGGEISFPDYKIKHKPKAGDVLVYKASIAHEVMPVTSGIRYSVGYGLTDDIMSDPNE